MVSAAKFAVNQFSKSEHGRKIEVRIGDALDTLKKLQEEAVFDLVFLDADKAGYKVIFNFSLITIWSSEDFLS